MISLKYKQKNMNPIIDHLNILPPILYKYRVFDSKGYGLDYAINGTAYFPSAKELNDPFETYFRPKSIFLCLKGKELRNFLRMKAKQDFPNADVTKIKELVEIGLERRQFFLNGDPRGFQPILELQYRKFGILSLTRIPDSIPMWAYYGDSNKGFCVGLHTHVIAEHQSKLVHNKKILSLHRVRYQKDLPEYNIDIDQNRGVSVKDLAPLEATVYTKSVSWKHEGEYRLLYYDHPSSIYSFGKNSVAEVIIGINAKNDLKTRLIKTLSNENPKVRLLQAVKSINSYKINFEDI
jgi:hypothetical protein